MSIKAWLIGGTALFGTVATATISTDVGNYIETRSLIQQRNNEQRLVQQEKEWYLEHKVDQALIDNKVATYETLWYTLRWSSPIVLVGICATGLWLFRGWALAEVKKAHFEATQIKLDPVTRTYPIVAFEAAGKIRLHDPNSKMTLAIDSDREPVPLMVASNTAVQLQTMATSGQEVDLPTLWNFANHYLEAHSSPNSPE